MTDEAIEQRQDAPRKHGAYSLERRGDAALDTTGRSRLEELKETVQEREGVLVLMKERAATAVMMVEMMTAYAAKKHREGVPLDRIPTLKSLPAFMNSAQRALKDLLAHMPDDKDVLDAQIVLDAVIDGQENGKAD